MKLPEGLIRLLKEWDKDCIQCHKQYGQRLPHAKYIYSILSNKSNHETVNSLYDLLGFIAKEFKEDIGIMPAKDCKVVDAYSKFELGLEFSIREEQHEVYWLIQDFFENMEI